MRSYNRIWYAVISQWIITYVTLEWYHAIFDMIPCNKNIIQHGTSTNVEITIPCPIKSSQMVCTNLAWYAHNTENKMLSNNANIDIYIYIYSM